MIAALAARLSSLSFLPRSLATRTALVLVASLVVVQVAGLTIHALDRIDVLRLAQVRDIAVRVMGVYRSVALTAPDLRATMVGELEMVDGSSVKLESIGPVAEGPPAPPDLQRQLRVNMQLVPLAQPLRPKEVQIVGGPDVERVILGLRLADGRWLNFALDMPPPRPWHSANFLGAFLLMTACAAALSVWTVRRLVAPVATLARAAEALGRDVAAAPLPEDGPTEVAQAAAAFNTMAARIRRFVQDRTFLLTAIGHDLRTPITRLKLRAEFMEDDEQRRKMLLDLDELESMVAATLAFGRDATLDEAAAPVDLAELARTVLDEAADARPADSGGLEYVGPEHLPVRARARSLKRALTNLVTNALKYGDSATITLAAPAVGMIHLTVEDCGPGIPQDDLERVFQPFLRLEPSRNRETGGMGLGLPIARNILRAHGGDVTLANRAGGGVRATMTLPA